MFILLFNSYLFFDRLYLDILTEDEECLPDDERPLLDSLPLELLLVLVLLIEFYYLFDDKIEVWNVIDELYRCLLVLLLLFLLMLLLC